MTVSCTKWCSIDPQSTHDANGVVADGMVERA